MPVIFKAVSPKRFEDKAFERAIEQEIRPYAEGVKRDFEKTYATWSSDSQPTLDVKVTINPYGGVSIEANPEGQIYEWVHEGTQPHAIRPRRAKRLAFQSGYRAKTAPGRIAAVGGGLFGNVVFARAVQHPGFPGRHFSEQIVQKWREPFYKAVQRSLSRGAKDSGHSL